MSVTLLLPAALGALAAILAPLAIHIARSTETRTIDFAALRWLNPGPKPVRRLRIDELWLLAVRIALVVAVALFLARPVLWDAPDSQPVVAVSPEIDPGSIEDLKGRRVWLAPGFPGLHAPAPVTSNNVSSLIRQLDAETPVKTQITLIVPSDLNGVDAERPRLSRQVDWLVAPSLERPTSAIRREPLPLTVRYAAGAEDGVRYFRAAATAWTQPGQPPALDARPADQPLPARTRYLVWLSSAPMSAAILEWIEQGGVALLSHDTPSPVDGVRRVTWRDALGEPLATAGQFGQGRVLQLTRQLEPAAMPQLVEAGFPDALSRMLDPLPAPARVAAVDHAPTTGAMAYRPQPSDLRPWFALLIALIFLAERWLATRRRRAVTP